mgnify:CR=1 FL=1
MPRKENTKAGQISIGEHVLEVPIYDASIGPSVVDVGSLTAHGYFTYDPGFVSTASCDSKITYIDGDLGILLHRGYPISELAEKSNHLEVCYLLINGELPTTAQLETFESEIAKESHAKGGLDLLLDGFNRSAHPMAKMCALTGALAGLYHDSLDINNPEDRAETIYRLIAKMPILAAMVYNHSRNTENSIPNPDHGYSERFLHLMFSEGDDSYAVNPIIAKAMDKIFLLHADHEQNASTSTVRMAGSTGTNPYAAIAAGIAALWGPAHGGANEAVLNMLDEIGSENNIDKYVRKAKDRDDPFRIMGFGHRVYKNYDPRAKVMQQTCHEVLGELGVENDPILRMAQRLEQIALEDEYFVDRKLYPNVDFYSGIILKAIGIPTDMFTVIFTVGRTPGWISHWNEMLSTPYKIGRPRQLYTGEKSRQYIPLDLR